MFHPDLVVAGIVAELLAGLFFLSAVGRGRPRRIVMQFFEVRQTSLQFVRDAVAAKARGQATALLFFLGWAMMLAGFLFPGTEDSSLRAYLLATLFVLALLLWIAIKAGTPRTLRRYVREHLSTHDYPFEERPLVTRAIGDLFGVAPEEADTIAEYAARVRQRCSNADRPS